MLFSVVFAISLKDGSRFIFGQSMLNSQTSVDLYCLLYSGKYTPYAKSSAVVSVVVESSLF